ncbi:conserved exported hypothetical protein [Mesorhizobium sp. ORS 3324]|nr:conserved exported hypothetical protein [Mesorhizobium sp. ORS 3324]
MQRFSIGLMGALLGISLVTGPAEAGEAKVATTRTERRTDLSRPVQRSRCSARCLHVAQSAQRGNDIKTKT